MIIGATDVPTINAHIEAERWYTQQFFFPASSTYRAYDAEKSGRLWAIGYCIVYDSYDLTVAETLEIPVHHFSTGAGSLYIIYEDGRSTHEWKHEKQSWVRGEDFQAIQCMKTIIQREQDTFTFIYSEPAELRVMSSRRDPRSTFPSTLRALTIQLFRRR